MHATLDNILSEQGSKSDLFFLVCDEIQDPHNLGALIRTAAAVKADAVIIPKRRSAPITPTVDKVSVGTTKQMRICQVPNIHHAILKLKEYQIFVIGLDMQGKKSIFDVALMGPLALVLGNEGEGMRRMVRESCDDIVYIPMPGTIESLNVSVAGGIAMYEVLRQRLLQKS